MNAVDSENKKNLQDDSRRLFQLEKHLSKPGHVWRKFGTGNKKTLMQAAEELVGAGKIDGNVNEGEDEEDGGPAGREARRRLIEWYSKEYCASRMSLAVVGKGHRHFVHQLHIKLPLTT
jgi:insulysin